MKHAITAIKNFNFAGRSGRAERQEDPNKLKNPGKGKTPAFYISKVQFDRIRHDVQMWREAVQEAEQAWYPHRVKMQRIYLDTILNEHVESCIRRRKSLTLSRKFKLCDDKGKENEEVTKLFKASWFRTFQSYVLDAILHGYNLISLGDLEKDAFPNLSFIQRQNISPDRMMVGQYVYSISGERFTEEPYANWFIYVKTPTETGSSPCGYGLLYKIARTEIILRNNLGQNADYNEVFGQPIRKGTTSKQDDERNEFENALRTMGSNPYIILDEGQDTLEIVQGTGTGTAYQTYDNLEKRCEQKISKVLLGHADALDSTPGKLGASQDGESSPINTALMDIQSEDAEFIQPIINNDLLPRMRLLGFNIPEGLHFEYVNDDEKEAFRKKEDNSNKVTAEIAQIMSNAGLQMDAKYFEERTGIPTEKKEEPKPMLPPGAPGAPGEPAGPDNADPKEAGKGKKPVPGTPKSPDAVKNLLMSIADFIESEHPRAPKGSEIGGQFVKKNESGGTSIEHETVKRLGQKADKAMTSLTETGGFSITDIGFYGGATDAEKFKESGNYIVALGGFEKQIPLSSFGKADIIDYFTKHKDKFLKEQNLILGGWHNKENGIVYLDISKAFKSKAEAIKFGKMSKQIAGWDAKKGEEFSITKSVKNSLTPQQQSEKMKAMFGSVISMLDPEDDEKEEHEAGESAEHESMELE